MNNLKAGGLATEFSGTDYLGNPVASNHYKGKKVLLSFFRGASCPFCNLRIHQLIKQFSEFEQQGIAIIAVFAASSKEISSYAGQQNAPFPIVSDPHLDLYRKYGIEATSWGMVRAMINPLKMIKVMFSGFFNMKSLNDKPLIPADFLIDEDQKLYRVYYGKDFGDHLSMKEILGWKR
ncbi:MAG: AhpC/TSA family protein [Cyclobacteriaceae bacterium]|nr:AhpC/TSA family protein [Cyclobacteriaceae bacterium]